MEATGVEERGFGWCLAYVLSSTAANCEVSRAPYDPGVYISYQNRPVPSTYLANYLVAGPPSKANSMVYLLNNWLL